jgi:lysophospholipase L1-like esterase
MSDGAEPRVHRAGPVLRAAAALAPGVRRVVDQIPAHAEAWARDNAAAPTDPAPLWVALGDSTAQGIGADHHRRGYVGQLAERLDAAGRHHALVNLSVTGAVVRDVLEDQLARLLALPRVPALVTCSVGANDLRRTARLGRLASDLETLVGELGHRGVIATIPIAPVSVSGRWLNGRVRAAAAAAGVAVAELDRHRRTPLLATLASDAFHPSEFGYGAWADAFAEACGLEPTPPSSPAN